MITIKIETREELLAVTNAHRDGSLRKALGEEFTILLRGPMSFPPQPEQEGTS